MPDWTPATPEAVAALIARHSGHSGDGEAETHINLSRADEADGYVEIWSDRGAHVAAMLKRAGSALLAFEEKGAGVTLRFRRDAIRGPASVLKNLDNKGAAMPDHLRVSLRSEGSPAIPQP